MALEDEVNAARSKIFRDGYDMSFGEIISLYERQELKINPEYQRLFRWSETQKTRFIESVLLSIPIPPIFVFSDANGVWELVDGLQRISTILETAGILKKEGNVVERFVCVGTRILPSLDNKKWRLDGEDAEDPNFLPASLQVAIKRARVRVEILAQNTDPKIRYELFQRLNTGGSNLSEQEIRSCVVISLNRYLFDAIKELAGNADFSSTVKLTENRGQRQFDRELITRFLVYRSTPYDGRLDVHEYLDEGIVKLSEQSQAYIDSEKSIFFKTFSLINAALGSDSFKRYDGNAFGGLFSIAAYEFVTLGVSKNIERFGDQLTKEVVAEKIKSMSLLPNFGRLTASGVRGTQRLSQLIFREAEGHFAL